MSDPITAAMIGAAIGGGTSLAKGKSLGKSLENAAISGVLGGTGGYLGGAMGGAGGAGASTGAAVPGSIGTELVFNPATGTYLNPSYFAGATSSMPLYTGAGSTLSQVGTGLGSLGSQFNTGIGSLGGSTLDALKSNPVQTASLGMNVYDRANQSNAPLQPSPTLSAQQLVGQSAVPVPQFNSILQLPRRPILIG